MAEGRRRDEWDRAAAIQAAALNAQRTRKRDMVSPRALNPFTAQDYKKNTAVKDVGMLAAMCGVKVTR